MTSDRRRFLGAAGGAVVTAGATVRQLWPKHSVDYRKPRCLVAVLNGDTYSERLEELLLDGLKLYPIHVRGKSVLLKPNLVEDLPGPVNTDRDARRCWLVLDKVQGLNKLPQLPKALTKQRKSGNPIVIGFQGMSQIDAHYGKQAETMLSQPFNNFILRTKEPRASKYLSDLIGRVQIERLRETKPAYPWAGQRQRSYNTERVIEPLVLDSEIQSLEDLTGYFLQGGKVVRIQFAIRPLRIIAPALIERIIPGVQTRPLDPELVEP